MVNVHVLAMSSRMCRAQRAVICVCFLSHHMVVWGILSLLRVILFVWLWISQQQKKIAA